MTDTKTPIPTETVAVAAARAAQPNSWFGWASSRFAVIAVWIISSSPPLPFFCRKARSADQGRETECNPEGRGERISARNKGAQRPRAESLGGRVAQPLERSVEHPYGVPRFTATARRSGSMLALARPTAWLLLIYVSA